MKMAALAVASCLLAMLCGFLLLFRSKRKTEEVRNDEKNTMEGKRETTKDKKERNNEFGECKLEEKALTQRTNGTEMDRPKERKEKVQQEPTERRTARNQRRHPKEKR